MILLDIIEWVKLEGNKMSLVVNIKQDHKNIKIVKTNLMKLLNNQ